jgi:hypothetical protein
MKWGVQLRCEGMDTVGGVSCGGVVVGRCGLHATPTPSHRKSNRTLSGASRSGCVSRPYTACVNEPKILDGVSSNCTALRYARYPRGPFQLPAIGQVVLPQDGAIHVGKA